MANKSKPTQIKIDKKIPVPFRSRGLGRYPIYPWAQMEIGDSFFVPGKTVAGFSGQAGKNSAMRNRKYTCRAVEGGVRVWRIK